MRLDHIELTDFRNVAAAEVEFHPGTNVLIGENAQGKTNLVEAVYLLACAKSFRSPRLRDLIRHGENAAKIKADVSGEGLPFQLSMTLREKEGKEILKNGVKLTRLSEFLGLFRVVLFCPEHLSLMKEGPGKRRSFLDAAICQLRPYYASLLNECNKLEAQRAALLKQSLKQPVSRDLMRCWEERLASVSVKIACIRADYVKKLAQIAPLHYHKISREREALSLTYESDVYDAELTAEEMEQKYLSLLETHLERDIRYGFTQRGVHRDDLAIFIDSYPARTFASQGQQRSAVLSLKLSEGEISRAGTGQDPIYLLDDVLSELDEGRRSYITGGLAGKQVILTGCDPDAFGFVDRIHKVKAGVFSR